MGYGMGAGQSRAGSASDEERMMQVMMASMQMQDYLTMYNSTTEKCFKKCVFNLRTPQLVEKEEVCLNRCIEKMSHYNLRFQQKVGAESAALREQQQKEAEQKQQPPTEAAQADKEAPSSK